MIDGEARNTCLEDLSVIFWMTGSYLCEQQARAPMHGTELCILYYTNLTARLLPQIFARHNDVAFLIRTRNPFTRLLSSLLALSSIRESAHCWWRDRHETNMVGAKRVLWRSIILCAAACRFLLSDSLTAIRLTTQIRSDWPQQFEVALA